MWIVFNKSGAIVKDFQEYGAPARQGTAGGFYIFVYTEGLQINRNYIASIIFERPDKLTTSAYTMDYVARFPFSKNELDDPNISIDPMMDGQTYPGFIFYVNNAGLFSASGTYRATVRIYDGRNQLTQGVITFNAQESAYLDDAEINFTQEQYDTIMNKLSEYGADVDDLQTDLAAETTARVNADADLQGQIDTHTSQIAALDAEMDTKQDVLTFDTTPIQDSTNPVTSGGVYNYVNAAIDEHEHDVTVLDEKINKEITDRENADTTLQGNIDAEERRAKAVEGDLSDAIQTEGSQRAADDVTLQRAIESEETRATTKEGDLETAIGAERTRASTKEGQLETAIGNEVTAREQADQALGARVTALEGLDVLTASDIADNLTTNDSSKVLSAKQGKVLKDALDSEESTRQNNDNTLQTNIDNEATTRANADSALTTRINNLDLSQVGAAGSYIKLVSQTDGLVSATAEAFDTEITANPSNINAPTTKAVKDYVDDNGGKIDSISVNNVAQTIDANKNVNIDLSNYVTLSNAQTITGKKTIKADLEFETVSGAGTTKLTIKNDNGYNSKIKMGSTENIRLMTSSTEFGTLIKPITTDVSDIGSTSNKWKDLYLSGSIKDGTNTFELPSTGGTLALKGEIPSLTNYVTLDGTQTISGTKNFTGTVEVSPSVSGVQLGIDNGTIPNANISIVSNGDAAYIDMGVPSVDYGFRIIKWNDPDGVGTSAQFVYGNNEGTIAVPKANGTMALTSDISGALASYYTSSQVDTLLNAKQDNLTFDSAPTANSTNPVTSEGIKTYVDTNGGKIDSISVNNVAQTIDANKNVDITVPTKTSDLTNDGDGISNFATLSDVSTSLGDYVTLATAQTITGAKTFNGDITIGTYQTSFPKVLFAGANVGRSVMLQAENYKLKILSSNTLIGEINTSADGVSNYLYKFQTTTPLTNNTFDLGNTSLKWRDLYIAGTIKDGTNTFSLPSSTGTLALSSEVTAVDDKLDANVHIEGNSDEITYNGDTVTKVSPYKNLKTGTTGTRSEVIHLANDTTAGMMSPADYNKIRSNTARIEQLEGQTRRLLYTASQNPTQQEIGDFVDDYLESIGITPSAEEYAGIAVVVAGTYHIWHYYNTQGIGWRDDGLDTVTTFTNSVAGIILGSSNDGQVYAENDGTGSVYGWSDLKNRVSNVETGMVSNVTYDTTNKKITKTINSVTSDVVTTATLKTDMGLATVATSGSYTDLSNKPTIPSVFLGGDWGERTLTVDNTTINVVTTDEDQTISGENTFTGINHFTAETEFTHEEYCPYWADIASGIGKSSLFTRGAFMQAVIGQILTANDDYADNDTKFNIEAGKLKIEDVVNTSNGQPIYNTIAEFSASGLDLKGTNLILSSSGKISNGTYTFALPSVSANKTLATTDAFTLTYDPDFGDVAYLDANAITYTSASSSGTATFVKTINGGSGTFEKTQKYLHPTTTSVVTSVTVGGTASAVTGISAGHLYGTRDTTSVSTRRTLKLNYASASASGTATVATGVTVGNTVDAITGLSASTTETTGDILYMENATHTHTGASVATSGSAVTGITSGSVSFTPKYLKLSTDVITFMVNGVACSYKAERGMTWSQWVASNYNNVTRTDTGAIMDTWSISGNSIIMDFGGGRRTISNVTPSDVITSTTYASSYNQSTPH